MTSKNKPLLYGMIGSVGLLSVYALILTIAESLDHAVTQFVNMWIWISLLVIGFGTQVGLFTMLRMQQKAKSKGATAKVAAMGGVSTGSMIACCAHHLADLLPLVGLSAAAVFLARYQLPFILLGVFSNLIGIIIILTIMQRHNLHPGRSFFILLSKINMRTVRTTVIAASALIVGSAFLLVSPEVIAQGDSTNNSAIEFATQSNDENLVTFEVTPFDFRFGAPVLLEVSMNTHVGDLDFNLTENSKLKDSHGTIYAPIAWVGDSPGGHHRSGTLTFPAISSDVTSMILIIENVYDVPERSFIWKLQ
jgi:hypothetical protein